MENTNELKDKVVSGLIWKFLERIGAQLVSFIVTIILARILMPEDYGIVSMVLVFITLANVFVSNGFGSALIQKKDADETDYSTMFYCSLVISLVLYAILFMASPLIASFYNNDKLILVLRVFSLKLPIAAVNSIQHAYVSKKLIFKRFFFSTLIGTVLSAIIGIMMAYYGCGVWALVAQYLINSIVDTLVLFITVPWRPKFKFSINSAKSMLKYGWKVTLAELISSGYNEIYSLIIGKIYSSADLAYYKRGNQFPDLAINNVDIAIGSVLFPAMSSTKGNKDQIRNMTRGAVKTSSYIIFPVMIGLIVVAKPLISLLLTDKWLLAVPFMQLACLNRMTMPFSTANNQAVKALGRSDIFLKMEILKKTLGIILVLSIMHISVMAIAISTVIYSIIATLVNIYPNKKLLNYGYKSQFLDVLPFFLMSCFMGIVCYSVFLFNLSNTITLIIQVTLGIIIYIVLSHIFKIEPFYYILNYIKDK